MVHEVLVKCCITWYDRQKCSKNGHPLFMRVHLARKLDFSNLYRRLYTHDDFESAINIKKCGSVTWLLILIHMNLILVQFHLLFRNVFACFSDVYNFSNFEIDLQSSFFINHYNFHGKMNTLSLLIVQIMLSTKSLKMMKLKVYLRSNEYRLVSTENSRNFSMIFLDYFLLHYLDNFFYIIYKEEESLYKNETTKNVYPAGEVSDALNNKLCIFTLL